MREILIPRYPINARDTQFMCAAPTVLLRDGRNRQPTSLYANTPYLLTDSPRPGDLDIINILATGSAARGLAELSTVYGSENVEILARFQELMTSAAPSGVGVSTAVYAERMGQLGNAIGEYEKALFEFRAASRSGSPLMVAKRAEVERSFGRMNRVFGAELRAITAEVKARRGTALTRVERGLNIARSSRNTASLQVQNQAQAHQLVHFSQHAKMLGNGLAVIDFGSRTGRIHNAYTAGDDWHREMFVQSSSFALSAGAATGMVKIGVAGLGALMMITTLGPVVLVASGVVIAGSAAAAAIGMDYAVSKRSGGLYDRIMEALR